ncbi:MAG: OFA family MFS transporter, partial [Clostridiales bacterium]|nr:OFA family MFS transporter [Clostridiales bacterium]
MRVNNFERWARLIFGTVVLVFAGVIYSWSVLKFPFATEFGWDAGVLGLNATLSMAFFCIGGFLSGLLTGKTTPRLRLILSAAMLFLGFFITSRLRLNTSPVALYLAYGVVAGTGTGFVFNTVISVTNLWFPDKKGLCSGFLLMGFGTTTLIIGSAADSMMRSEAIGWRTTYLILAIIIGLLFLIMAFVIKPPAPDTVFPEPKGKKRSAAATVAERELTAVEMVKRSSFWLLFTFIVTIAAVGTSAISFVTDILKEVGGSENFVVAAAGVLAVFNGLGRLFNGVMFDTLGLRKTQYLMSALLIAAPVVVVIALLANSLVIAVFGMMLCFFTYGFAPTTSAAFVPAFYGTKHFAINFSK